MPNFLYTLPNCKHCADAKAKLDADGEAFIEKLMDDPITPLGLQQIVGKVIAPVLVREDGVCYFFVEVGPSDHRFVKILS